MEEFLSTLSLRRATASDSLSDTSDVISIHALLAESDLEQSASYNAALEFLSTLSLRRATLALLFRLKLIRHFYPRSPCGERHSGCSARNSLLYFYPRSPCGERPVVPAELTTLVNISIHALLAESDVVPAELTTLVNISIHALLAESDTCNISANCLCRDFYPRSPCGERLAKSLAQGRDILFLSTLSLRRATITREYVSKT